MDTEIKVPSGENTELKCSPCKNWSRSVYGHKRYTYCQEFPSCLFLPCQSIHHHHQSLNRKGHWGTTDDFATSFLHFSLFSTALWVLPNSRPVHSLMLSSHLFLCPPCLLPPFTVPCKIVLARPDERPSWAFLTWARTSTFRHCPSSISSADHGVAHPARCPEGWFWRSCRGA